MVLKLIAESLQSQSSGVPIWKIPLTYLVPYCVSTYAGVSAIIAERGGAADV